MMAIKVALALLVFSLMWTYSTSGKLEEVLPDDAGCTSGFVTLNRLTTLLQNTITRNRRQRIIPDINFTCNGVITKWIVGAKWGGNDWYPDLQLWRETGNRTYTKVGNTTLRVGNESTSGVYEYPVDPPLEFQAGDILGIFQPHEDESCIRVNYERDGGPLNYIMFTGRQVVEPPLEEFTITEDTTIRDDTPLVAVEISTMSCTQGDVLQCTCGFMSLERLVILQTPLSTNNRQQRIFPQINFTCDGNITKWIMGAVVLQSSNPDYFPELQIWRDIGNNTYTKVGNSTPGNATPFLQGVAATVYEYTPEHPLEFQAGDILGVFQPRGALSQLRVYYEENNGPTSFDVAVGVNDTEPLLDTFNLTQSGVRTSSDLPLITVEISVSMSQEISYSTISTTTLQSLIITRLSTSNCSFVPRSVLISDTQSRSAEVEQTVSPSTSVSSVLNTASPLPTTPAIEVEQNTASPFPTPNNTTTTAPQSSPTLEIHGEDGKNSSPKNETYTYTAVGGAIGLALLILSLLLLCVKRRKVKRELELEVNEAYALNPAFATIQNNAYITSTVDSEEDAVYDEVQIAEDLVMERNEAYETNPAAIPTAQNAAYFTSRVDSAEGTGDVVTDGGPQREGLDSGEYEEPGQHSLVYDYVFV